MCKYRCLRLLSCTAVFLFFPTVIWANPGFEHPVDPIAPVILGVTGILFFAILGRFAARKFGQPSVLGELMMGIALGHIGYLWGSDFILILREGVAVFHMVDLTMSGVALEEAATKTLAAEEASTMIAILQGEGGSTLIQVAHTVDIFSRYGVIFLLFLVGLGTSLDEMSSVGSSSLRVAIAGVALPFIFGFIAARLLMPELSIKTDMFVAATLGATSIGITASVLNEMNKAEGKEGCIILGAAVMDDILGLIMLAIISGIIVSGTLSLTNVFQTILLAALFLILTFKLGPIYLRFSIALVKRLDIVEAKMFISFLFVMVLAWLANLVGLATIIGAFAGGMILADAYFKDWRDPRGYSIKELIMPLEVIFAPIFFVLMGVQVKLDKIFSADVIIIAAGLLIAAIIGKLLSGFVAGRDVNRLAIGIGMMPRGEVGLIFASIGKTFSVLSDELFAAIVLMVVITTLITPPLLKKTLSQEN